MADKSMFVPTSVAGNLSATHIDPIALRQSINLLAIAINNRSSGAYELEEYLCSRSYYPDPLLSAVTGKNPVRRPVFRKVISFGALPNTATKNVAHGITFGANTLYSFTHIYGTATDQVNGVSLPLPYASPTDANNIELLVNGANVSVTTGSDRSAFLVCYIVLEWIKN